LSELSKDPELRVLIVEDRETDAILLARELKRGGYAVEFERVETGADLEQALQRGRWDVVLSDFSMPQFDALSAFETIRASGIDVPFIIVSGTIGEAAAVRAMRAGVQDYVPKDQLARLVAVVQREIREAQLRAERRAMQEQLLVSERMASLGTLAAGLAHEINNPLAAVLANLDFLLQDLEQTLVSDRPLPREPLEGLRQPLSDARDAADRIRAIVADLRMLARGDEVRRGPVDVNALLEGSLRIAANEIRHRARVVKEYQPVPRVDGNEARLGQVFLNLLMNAAQAIPEGRSIRNEIRVATRVAEDGRVSIEVSDTGMGIPRESMARIFDPFYTTKPIGMGMGLGLAICHRIIVSLGGEIRIESEVAKGTRVTVLLPPHTESVLNHPSQRPITAGRRGRVLVVDDEPIIGAAVQRLLGADHDVIVYTLASEALSRIAAGDRFDALLVDVMMPEMTGFEFTDELSRAAPELVRRVIYATGGAFTPRTQLLLEQSSHPKLTKPFEANRLHQLVNQLVRSVDDRALAS